MATLASTTSHQSTATLAGAWKLAGGRAMTLQPRETGVLRVARGSLWVTGEGPHPGPPSDRGDRVLRAGEQIELRRRQRVVIEAWNRLGPAYFTWDPLPQPVAHRMRVADLAQPAEGLRLAFVRGVRAAGRLAAALVPLVSTGNGLGRVRLAECAFKAHSRA